MTDAFILGTDLDTNGQNARYVRAAEKHGQAPSVIDALAIGNVDPGGVVARLQDAAGKHPEVGLRIRSAHKNDQYFKFPADLRWGHDAPPKERQEVRALAHAADLLHLNNSDRGLFQLGLQRSNKPLLLHHHGTLFRNNTAWMLDKAKQYKMIQAVSTIDLKRPAPDILHWLPTAYDVEWLAAFGSRSRREPDGRVRIGHFPTNRDLKMTDLFVAAVRELQEEGLPVDLVPDELSQKDWLPRWEWHQAMSVKATCDIVYDQLNFGYGCNAVEAWGMGIPVIAGADEWTLQAMRDEWGYLPFQVAQPHSLKGIIRKMVESEQMRQDVAVHGYHHVLTHHDELPALTRLAELYHDAIALRHKPRIQGKGVTFQSSRRKVMTFDGQPVDFTKGTVTVTDERVIGELRKTARQRPRFGVEEVA